MDLSSLDNTGGSLALTGNDSLTTINLPALQTVVGDLIIVGNDPGSETFLAGSVDVTGTATFGDTSVDIAEGDSFSAMEVMIEDGGMLGGEGEVIADMVTNNGMVDPGSSPGELTITGDYVQTTEGELLIEIAGLIAGSEHDVLTITDGSATLDGTLSIDLLSFTSQIGDQFTILTATGGITGEWTDLNIHDPGVTFSVAYNDNDVTLNVIALVLLGDANNDLLVTGLDLISVQQNFGKAEAGPPTGTMLGDANDDGLVTGLDLITVQQNFGKAIIASPVPEPASVGLLAVLGGVIPASRRRRF